MLGYITKEEAKKIGFTHHGKYFGIPVWMTNEECPMVAAKFAPFDYLMDLASVLEGFIGGMLFPEDEPVFKFLLGEEIE